MNEPLLIVLCCVAAAGCHRGEEGQRKEEGTRGEQASPRGEAGPRASPLQDRMCRVLDADKGLSDRYMIRYPDRAAWARGQVDYARAMSALDLEGTPPDFAEVFRVHQAAWVAYAAFLEGLSADQLAALGRQGHAAPPDDPEGIAERGRRQDRDIATSWAAVEAVAGTSCVDEGPSFTSPPPPVGSTRRLIRRAGRRDASTVYSWRHRIYDR